MELYLDPETAAFSREVLDRPLSRERSWTVRGPAFRRNSKPRCRRASWPHASSNPQLKANGTVTACVTQRWWTSLPSLKNITNWARRFNSRQAAVQFKNAAIYIAAILSSICALAFRLLCHRVRGFIQRNQIGRLKGKAGVGRFFCERLTLAEPP